MKVLPTGESLASLSIMSSILSVTQKNDSFHQIQAVLSQHVSLYTHTGLLIAI